MSDLPGYDEWKTTDPADEDRCEFCGASASDMRDGWAPRSCTGECERRFRDPDAELERRRDDPPPVHDREDF